MKNYIGIDWNGYSKTEGTTVVVLRKEIEKFYISNIHKMAPGLAFTTQIEQISRMILNYRAARVGADIGMGTVQCQMLQKDFGQRVASVYYSSYEEDIKYNAESWMLTCNRDRNMTKALKKVGFPFAVFRAQLGGGVFKPESESEFHALNYAYLAARLDKLLTKIRPGDDVRILRDVADGNLRQVKAGEIGKVNSLIKDGADIVFGGGTTMLIPLDCFELVEPIEEPPIFPTTEAKVEEWMKFLQTFDPQVGQLSSEEIARMEPSTKIALVNLAIERDKLREEQFKRKMKETNRSI